MKKVHHPSLLCHPPYLSLKDDFIPAAFINTRCSHIYIWGFFSFFFFSFLFFTCTHGIWKFLGQGWNLSQSCDLCHNCSNTRSLMHCTGPGIKPAPPERHAGSLTYCATEGTPRCSILTKTCDEKPPITISGFNGVSGSEESFWYEQVPQPWHYLYLGPNSPLLKGTLLCLAGCLPGFLFFTH